MKVTPLSRVVSLVRMAAPAGKTGAHRLTELNNAVVDVLKRLHGGTKNDWCVYSQYVAPLQAAMGADTLHSRLCQDLDVLIGDSTYQLTPVDLRCIQGTTDYNALNARQKKTVAYCIYTFICVYVVELLQDEK